ncbi:MAG: hypothetical protein K6C05_10620 [Anaerovibrio sp.]|uniref:hypothetical protein n=1 Tax=Anaerovibrio sp. TaxID=1872532 RepID=UPI0025E68FD9|nr:hypothetical protein [Anaerovibrio sp.]MCR5177283.1 hypothetical protein [Anaerovibrio sp.]
MSTSQIIVEGLDMVTDAGNKPECRILERMLQLSGDSEIILCLSDNEFDTVIKDIPGLTAKEVNQAVSLEIKYLYADNCLWGYEYDGSRLTIKTILSERVEELAKEYGNELVISGVIGLPNNAGQVDCFVDWQEFTPEALDVTYIKLLGGIASYLKNDSLCLMRLPKLFFEWRWDRISVLLFTLSMAAGLILGSVGHLWHNSLQTECREKKQQLALMEETVRIHSKTEKLTADGKKNLVTLAGLGEKGLGISGYSIMVYLSCSSSEGIVLSEIVAEPAKGLVVHGQAKNMDRLLDFINHSDKMGGWIKGKMMIEKTEQDENGYIRFTCKGKI